ncbi:hypothetical protein CcaCcLH18_09408 [Colletotrichum camelliae]|nr:hypothetical protein CcaCcLH18_09408 [Colletotrichum camelliae]
MGESAGGGSLMHHITAYGGSKGSAPFRRVVTQSAAFFPHVDAVQQEENLQTFLTFLNFTYNPVIDGGYVPSHQAALFARVQSKRDVDMMFSHNTNGGPIFTNALASQGLVDNLFSSFKESLVLHITDVQETPIFDGTQPHVDNLGRSTLLMAETRIVCNTLFLRRAFANVSFTYIFGVLSSLHGDKLKYNSY